MTFTAGTVWICGGEEEGLRLDLFLLNRDPDFSRSQVQAFLEAGCFTHNGAPARKNAKVKEGDEIEVVRAPELPPTSLLPEDIPLHVLYEDEDLIILDKPKGLVVHPGNGIHRGTLANGLLFRFGALSDQGGESRPGIVHRLDKDTSGVMAVARHNLSHQALSRQLESREMRRVYQAFAWGSFGTLEGKVEAPVGRNLRDPGHMAVTPKGKFALTHFRALALYPFATRLELRLETGRTHQIRVHLAHIAHPVVGDPLYGGGDERAERVEPLYRQASKGLFRLFPTQALHAHELELKHPRTGEPMRFVSPLPAAFTAAEALLEPYRLL